MLNAKIGALKFVSEVALGAKTVWRFCIKTSTKIMDTREKVQAKAKEIGHCLCSPVFKCPCNFFKKYDVCKCANEECGDKCNIEDWVNENI